MPVSTARTPPRSWTSVSSSCVDAIMYRDDTFYVRYHDKHGVTTSTCWYEGFGPEIYWEMLRAPSMGKFMWSRLYYHQPQGKL